MQAVFVVTDAAAISWNTRVQEPIDHATRGHKRRLKYRYFFRSPATSSLLAIQATNGKHGKAVINNVIKPNRMAMFDMS